jgi:hypothetical protein
LISTAKKYPILEAVITTETEDGRMHVAPMGPEVDDSFSHWRLKPFQTSATFANLRRTERCVVHVVDDAMLIARAVLGIAHDLPFEHISGVGFVLADACRVFGLKVERWDVSSPRAIADCEVVFAREKRPFFGWNRAKHAVVELAILASRVQFLDTESMMAEINRLRILVDKTGGEREHEAFELLHHSIEDTISKRVEPIKKLAGG